MGLLFYSNQDWI